jgi:lycopene cyclase domain-containing protein
MFYKRWKFAFPAIVLSAIPFIIWDIYFTKIAVWGFNPKYITGIYFFNLPIEEILFFIVIPYCCLFSYHCFNILVKKNYLSKFENLITALFIAFLVSFAYFYHNKFYSVYTFTLLALFLLFLKFKANVKWLSRFYFTYLFLLIPFLIVNGILTGTGIDEQVVWYNDNENMMFRILTIPFEDVFYGILLILLNIYFMEYFISKKAETIFSVSKKTTFF